MPITVDYCGQKLGLQMERHDSVQQSAPTCNERMGTTNILSGVSVVVVVLGPNTKIILLLRNIIIIIILLSIFFFLSCSLYYL